MSTVVLQLRVLRREKFDGHTRDSDEPADRFDAQLWQENQPDELKIVRGMQLQKWIDLSA